MTKVTMRLTGMKELKEALKRLPFRDARSDLAESIIVAAAEPIRDAAQAAAPVETGKLRDSIIVSRKLGRRQRTSFAKKPGEVVVHVGVRSGVPHGHLQEFGTRHHVPQPFLRPAWDAHKGGLVSRIGEAVWDAIARRLKGQAMPVRVPLETKE